MVKRNMKKFLSVLCISIFLLGLTACASVKKVAPEDEKVVTDYSDFMVRYVLSGNQELYSYLANMGVQVESLDTFETSGAEFTEAILGQIGVPVDGNGFISGIDSWKKAQEEAGEFVGMSKSTVKYGSKGDTLIVDLDVEFAERDAVVELVYDDDYNKTLKSFAVNLNYTFAEKMEKAGLNTLLGMGTVFIVLILLSLLIGCFSFINKAQSAAENRKKAAEEAAAPAKAVEAGTAVAEPEDVATDDELAVVIAAAIAAYESEKGVISPADAGGYFVRSIRRRSSNRWK